MAVLLSTLAILGALPRIADAKAVFAHYMVGTITQAHAQQDIDDAVAMNIDAFALNIGDPTQSYVTSALEYLYGYAEQVGFKLFVSMDISAYSGGLSNYQSIWDGYKGSSAYYNIGGKALISTFSSGGYENTDFETWKSGLADDMVFIPDFDDTDGYYEAADGWWSYWGDVVDGLFSWESAWPEIGSSTAAGDVSEDATVLAGAHDHSKYYMMAVSSLQYKDAYGADLYRLGDLNLVKRMQNLLEMSDQPDYVEIITWNDGPESHYIGSIWPEENSDSAPALYASEAKWPHEGWQPVITSFINAYKDGKSASEMTPDDGSVAVGAAWYHVIQTSASCSSDTKPSGWGAGNNYLYWAVVLNPSAASGYTVTVLSGSTTTTTTLSAGLNFGYGSGEVQTGAQIVQVKDPNGNIILTATGGYCVSSGCPTGVYTQNYQVLGMTSGSQSATCTSW